jgi:serine/threonine-protein kinase
MKRCPTCARTCPDDLTFCVDDGATLEATSVRTLADLAAARPLLPLARALRLARSLCDAYGPERTRGRVPPPLLPLDVEVTDDDRALVTFGHDAKPAASGERDLDPTAPFAAPETFPGGDAVSDATSVYHVAALLYLLLTGTPPFDGSTNAAVAVRKLLEDAPSARSLRPELPASLDAALARALDRDPTRRFASPAAFAEALAAVVVEPVAPLPTAAPPPAAFGAMAPGAMPAAAAPLPAAARATQVATAPPALPPTSSSRGLFVFGGGLALVGVIAALSLTLARPRRDAAPSMPVRHASEGAPVREAPSAPAPTTATTPVAGPVPTTTDPPAPPVVSRATHRSHGERTRTTGAPRLATRGARLGGSPSAPGAIGRSNDAELGLGEGDVPMGAPSPATAPDGQHPIRRPHRRPHPRDAAPALVAPPPAAPAEPIQGAPATHVTAPPVAPPPTVDLAPPPERAPSPVVAPPPSEATPLLPIALALGAGLFGLALVAVGLLLRRRAAPPPYTPPAYQPPASPPPVFSAPAPPGRPAHIPATVVVPADAPATVPDTPVWQGTSPDALAKTLAAAPLHSAVWCLRCGTPSPAEARFCPNDGVDLRTHGSTVDPHAARPAQATQPDMKPFAVGQYRCESRLGEGGMGVVYRARHADTGVECAVKVLLVRGRTEGQLAERFRKEARLAASVRHPNCVAIYDYGEVAGQLFYLAMELIDGSSLDEALGGRAMPAPRVAAIVEQVCAALDAAHAAGVVHRDLKPQNVMVRPDPQGEVVKLVDFGIARDLHASGSTLAGVVVGTPAYMAPEQARAEPGVDARADVFSVGVMTWELLTGRLPYELMGTAIQQVVARAMLRESVPPTGVSSAVDVALARATDPDVSRRTPDVRTFAAELKHALAA